MPEEFYAFLRTIRERQDVVDIRIEVKDQEDPDGWPSTDTIWFITSASASDVRKWFPDRLAPDEVLKGFDSLTKNVELYEVPEGMNVIGAWYD